MNFIGEVAALATSFFFAMTALIFTALLLCGIHMRYRRRGPCLADALVGHGVPPLTSAPMGSTDSWARCRHSHLNASRHNVKQRIALHSLPCPNLTEKQGNIIPLNR